MKRIYRIARPVSLVLSVYVFMISGPHQAAMAALVGTETVLDGTRVQTARERVRDLMAREEVQAALVDRGIDPHEARARAEALSDAEAVRLADTVESLPAAGGMSALGIVVGTLLIVFIVLLITDILGYTSVFPFTKKHR